MSAQSRYRIFVDIGSAVTKAYLFDYQTKPPQLVEKQEATTLDQIGLVVKTLLKEFSLEPGFDSIAISLSPKVKEGLRNATKEEDSLRQLVEKFSKESNFLLLEVGAAKSWYGFGIDGTWRVNPVDYGLGKGVRQILNSISTEAKIARWLTAQVSLEEIGDYIGIKNIFPGQIPLKGSSLQIEQAVTREILAYIATEISLDWSKIDQVLLSGAVLCSVPDCRQTLSMFLDGIVPEGVCQIFSDQRGILPVLWSIDGNSLLSHLVNLGTVVVCSHNFTGGEVLGRVFLDIGLSEELEVILESGDLVRVPLATDQCCTMRVELASGVEVKGFNPQAEISGGELGLIFDMRGRPLRKPELNEEGRRKVRQWQEALR